jgi:site-specific DNA-methyltransferase (adenine-specific)
MKDVELFNDHFQNYKTYGIPKAQLIIADIPYNIGKNLEKLVQDQLFLI